MGKAKIAGSVIKWVLGGLVLGVIFFVIGIILFRIFSLNTPKELTALTVNEPVARAYRENGGELSLFYQDQEPMSTNEKCYGYFAAPYVTFVKEAAQVQVVFRYNKSTLPLVQADYGLPDPPAREDEVFDLSLVVNIDKTPEITSDNDGNDPSSVEQRRVLPTSHTVYRNGIYEYRKFIFDGVAVDDLTLAVFLDVYYVGDVDYGKEPYGALCLYDYATKTLSRKLSADDRRALEAFSDGNP